MTSKESTTVFEPEMPTVPDGWDVLPFQKAATVISDQGKRVKQSTYSETGKIPVVDQGQDYIGGYIDDETMAYDGELPVILFGDHTRLIKYVDKRFAVGAEGIKILKPADGYNPKFFYYLLRSLQIPSRGYSRHFQFLKQFHLPIAPPYEQKLIVAEIEKQFSRLDEAVANLKRVKANLKRYKAAVLKAAVEGKLTEEWRKAHPDVEPASELLKLIQIERKKNWAAENPGKEYKEPAEPETSNLPELPDAWAWSRTDQLFHYVTSGSRGWASYYSESGPAFLRMGNLDHDTVNLDLSDIQRVQPPKGSEGMRTRVLPGDILISITADVGMVGIVPTDFEEAYINQHVALARPVTAVNHVYIAWYLAGKNGQDQLKKLQRGATKVGLGLDDIKSVDVPLPPIKEQQAIVAEFERRLSNVNELQSQVEINIKRAENLRHNILKSAFTGNILSL